MTTQPRIHGRYRVDERLGATRIATVYRAYDDKLSRTVLLNLMRNHLADQKGIRERFVSDSELRARNVHSALPEVYDSGSIENRPFFITEFITGKTLRERAPFSPLEALQYLKHIAGVINACQQAGIPHPPISSNDFVVVSEGHVKWLENWLLTPNQVLIDLASYRAPERKEGDPETPQSAVYAVGVLLFEMISGFRPFTGNSADEILAKHAENDIPPVSGMVSAQCPPQIDELMMRCVARNPLYRIQTLDELLNEIEQSRRELLIANSVTSGVSTSAGSNDDTTDIYGDAMDYDYSAGKGKMGAVLLITLLIVAALAGWYFMPSILNLIQGTPAPSTTESSTSTPDDAADVGLWERIIQGVDQATASVGDYINNDVIMPSWLKSLFDGAPAESTWLVVEGADPLDVRDAPASNGQVVAQIPAGSRVEWIDGPQSSDGIAWLRIRYTTDLAPVEGWARQSRLVVPTP